MAVAVVLLLASAAPAPGYDPAEVFKRGAIVVTPQVGGGANNNIEGHGRVTDIPQANAAVRISLLPLDPLGQGVLRGSLETGLEPFVHIYPKQEATAQGLKLVGRYHFLRPSPIFPYVEVVAGAAGTSLKVREIRSTFTFVLEAGVGLSYFLDEGIALTAGYRFQHISNGNVESPNRGFNSDTGVAGISIFFH